MTTSPNAVATMPASAKCQSGLVDVVMVVVVSCITSCDGSKFVDGTDVDRVRTLCEMDVDVGVSLLEPNGLDPFVVEETAAEEAVTVDIESMGGVAHL